MTQFASVMRGFALAALFGACMGAPEELVVEGAPLTRRPLNPTCVAPPRPTSGAGIRLTRVFGSIAMNEPVALLQAPGRAERFYLVERGGRVITFGADPATASSTVFADLRSRVDASAQETGLLGLAFHPDFARNGFVFASYVTKRNGRWLSRLTRFEASATALRPDTEQVVLELEQPFENHNGGHLGFGPDGKLYFAFGDGGSAGDPGRRAQNTQLWFGKILRLDVDSLPYRAPTDNPFVNGGGRPEIWAYGFRNPWRFSFDRATGEMWAGDVGQDRREEIDRVVRGGNYGWSELEGSLCFRSASCVRTGTILPVAEYGRDAGISVTGGYVYRGNAVRALQGTYLYADFGSGTLWGLFSDTNTGALTPRILSATGLNVSAFAEDLNGEVYVISYDGSIHRIEGDGAPSTDLPERLSATGCVDPADPRRLAGGLVPFEVSSPLWSDGAGKRRWAAIPDGTRARVRDDGSLELPVGSVLVKEFRIGDRRVETRLLVRHTDGDWAGYTYVWNDAQTDAVLARAGSTPSIAGQTWSVPSRGQCLQCHTTAAGRVLGFRTEQLDRAVRYEDGTLDNQLAVLARIGWLDRSVPAARPAVLPGPSEGTASIADRARSYLDGNCSGCHRPGGPGRGGLDLRYSTPFARQGLCDQLPATGDLGLSNARLFAPGDPARSVLLARMERRDSTQMPPLGTHLVDAEGAGLVREWIRSTGSCEGADWRRTVVFVRYETRPGQDVFLRGGIDPAQARERLGLQCTEGDLQCAVPIRHRTSNTGRGDTRLDWYGSEPGQPAGTVGTPTVWTTDRWPAAWGATRRVEVDGYGETPLNRTGPHYWMLDVDMDCSRTVDGWFELKAFVSGGPGWEPNIAQSGAPYRTINHLARCGEISTFSFGSGAASFAPVPR